MPHWVLNLACSVFTLTALCVAMDQLEMSHLYRGPCPAVCMEVAE